MNSSRFAILLKIWSKINNKYILTLVGFIIWIGFFDRNDLITTWSYQHKLNVLKKEQINFEDEISRNKSDLNNLRTNHDNLEKYAREQYFLKKDNEDVFLIVEN